MQGTVLGCTRQKEGEVGPATLASARLLHSHTHFQAGAELSSGTQQRQLRRQQRPPCAHSREPLVALRRVLARGGGRGGPLLRRPQALVSRVDQARGGAAGTQREQVGAAKRVSFRPPCLSPAARASRRRRAARGGAAAGGKLAPAQRPCAHQAALPSVLAAPYGCSSTCEQRGGAGERRSRVCGRWGTSGPMSKPCNH